MSNINPLLLVDSYKVFHHQMYPKGTELVYSNFTPRSSKHAPEGFNNVLSFGQQMVMKQIDELFRENFFSKPKDSVCGELRTELSMYGNSDYDVSHFEALHDLGYLPICVKAIKEGVLVPVKIPVLTIYNTKKEFYWITNYLETIISNLLWKPLTNSTIAFLYKKKLLKFASETDKNNLAFVDFQGHDFSMRGISGIDTAISSGLAHATSFSGSDTIPTVYGARKYYGEDGFVVGSVPATEHSIMCSGSKDDEFRTFEMLIDKYPTGILSIVSDTWDLWKVITDYLPRLKDKIMARDGKIVIRPDSGDPVDIICGKGNLYQDLSKWFKEEDSPVNHPYFFEDSLLDEVRDNTPHGEHGVDKYENIYKINGRLYKAKIHNISWNRYDKQYYFIDMYESAKITVEELPILPSDKGVVELLWDIFGGTVNDQHYKVLDSHIGCIYGDSITLDRAEQICKRLKDKGFASTNVVLGIGSFTYQMNTRDTFGCAIKATYVEINDKGHNIFKDPITDDGMKKSAKGLLQVVKENGKLVLKDQVSWDEEGEGELVCIYKDGKFLNQTTLQEIRNNVKTELGKNG